MKFLQIVDTTRYDAATADENTYKKIVLGSFDKGQDGKASGPSPPTSRNPLGNMDPQFEIGSSSGGQFYSSQRMGARVNTR